VPGLFALILFAAFNNFLGGVFMALMDAYGLSLMEVQEWGLLWAAVSCGFILSGLTIAKTGLGRNPLKNAAHGQPDRVVGGERVHAPVLGADARDRLFHLAVPEPVRRSFGADHAAEGRALRAAGAGCSASRNRSSSRPRR
jgi:hypothetical protein